jgi:hypothetical protein
MSAAYMPITSTCAFVSSHIKTSADGVNTKRDKQEGNRLCIHAHHLNLQPHNEPHQQTGAK